KAGDTLKKGQSILEIETDKAVLEIPSDHEGVIKEVLIKPGTAVKVGQPIFRIEGNTSTISSTPTPTRGHVQQEQQNVSPSRLPSKEALNVKAPQGNQPTTPPSVRKDIPAAPSVRLLARELGIDIAQIPGSG